MRIFLTLLTMGAMLNAFAQYVPTAQADSAWLFTYATTKNGGRNGLHFAWSTDLQNWQEIGPEWAPVKSDYGTWGPQKRMIDPCVSYNTSRKRWEATWRVNEQESVVAYTYSDNLYLWHPQDYYALPGEKAGTAGLLDDFNHRAPVASIQNTQTLDLPFSGEVRGQVHRVAWSVVNELITAWQLQQVKGMQNAERAVDDRHGRFSKLTSQEIAIRVQTEGQKAISDKLIGIFFEDINFAADGGLYAELVQNRDFEYSSKDNRDWKPETCWEASRLDFSISTESPIHENNPHYAVLKAKDKKGSFSNAGWDGITLHKNAKYDLSLFGRVPEGKNTALLIKLTDKSGKVLAETKVALPKGQRWKQVKATLKAKADAADAHLVIVPQGEGTYNVDFVSLFPQDTYKGRKNGMRRDLAEALEALHPQFIRFPGGCASHGNGIDNIYKWKNTVGPLESRKPDFNIWHYHQTVGLGYYEYFQLCEDLGARPLPVLAAGVPCQNSSVGGQGQQGGIPLSQMDAYIQDVLDLIEWANGDPKTSKWARMRAEAGHPKPFNLTMIGIGNEDLIGETFEIRYKMICQAIKSKYSDMEIVGTVGPWCEGSDYEWGWRLAREMKLEYVDEHYYNSPGWFINNQDYYDRYARKATKVYLGEYASHIHNRANCIETALSEALYLCSVERNADVVAMTSYAPLFAKKGHTQWNPDMIYFTNQSVELTTGYQVQKLFGQNAGTLYLPSQVRLQQPDANVQKRIGSSAVIDSATGDLILKVVNYLPVGNTFRVQVPAGYSAVGEALVLTGELSDTRAVPVSLQTAFANDELSFEAPAYSFMVVRLQSSSEKK